MDPQTIQRLHEMPLAEKERRLKELHNCVSGLTPDELEERVWLEVDLDFFCACADA
jgi:hypothetical protein